MAEENKRASRIAPSMRSAVTDSESSRSANKARSYRAETYRPADPSKPGPQVIILESSPSAKSQNKSRESSRKENSRKEHSKTESSRTERNTEYSSTAETNSMDETTLQAGSPLVRLKKFISSITGEPDSSGSGSGVKKKQAQRMKRNDLLKKGLIGLIALIIVILLIIVIVNNSQVRDVTGLSISSTATTQTLKWSGAKKGQTYEVYRSEGSGQYQLIDTLKDGENTKTYDNLTSGTLYKYNIVTVKGNGEKTQGTSAQDYTKPNSVTRTFAATTAENTLTANWSLQGSAEGYELQYGLYDNLRDATTVSFTSDQAQYNSSSDSYSYTVDGLVTDETYYMSLRSYCADSYSEWCPVFSGTVTASADISTLDPDQPMIALTFDSGPDAGFVTSRILDTLSSNNSLATFFPTGEAASLYPDTMKRIAEEGHEIGNHTYDNSHVGGEVTADDILSANTAIEAACGVSPKLFRAPQGEVTDAIIDTCQTAGMAVILFNFDSHDWEIYDGDSVTERILEYADDGDIIQFRFMDDYDHTADAIDNIVPALIDEGYQLVTVTQLIQAKTGSVPLAGEVYNSAFD